MIIVAIVAFVTLANVVCFALCASAKRGDEINFKATL